MGRWSARHRKTAVLGWLAFVVLAIAVGSLLPRGELTAAESMIGPPAQAQRILDAHGWREPAAEMVLVQPADGAAGQAALADVVATLGTTPGVTNVASPLTGAPLTSADGRSALVTFDIAGDPDDADARIGAIQDAVAAVADRHEGVRVEEFGDTSANAALDRALSDD